MTPSPQSESTSDGIAISVKGLSKAYRIWRDPSARLKAPLWDILGSIIPKVLRPRVLAERLEHRSHSKYFKDFYALNDITIRIGKGETVGIIGKNGSGKSTLLQIICGTLQPTSGTTITIGRIAALLELGSGFNPEFTGRENIYLNASVLGLSREDTEKKLDEILNFAEIGDFIEQPIKTYSSGMVVRLAFAVQTAVSPDILIVDEALAVGDEAFQRRCFSKIESMQRSGTTILFVSHDSGSIIQLCDRAILLDNGEIKEDGSPREVIKSYQRLIYGNNVSTENGDLDPSAESGTTPQNAVNYDPNLVSKTIESYGDKVCKMHSWKLISQNGEIVNQLFPHSKYRISFSLELKRDVSLTRFGCSIKTINGTMISGCFSQTKEERFPLLRAGANVHVSFAFNCLMTPGTYFVNIGAFGQTSGEEIYIGRIVDAIIFRVLSDDSIANATEIVDLIYPAETTLSEI